MTDDAAFRTVDVIPSSPFVTASVDCFAASEAILIHLLGFSASPLTMPNVMSTAFRCNLSPALKVVFSASVPTRN